MERVQGESQTNMTANGFKPVNGPNTPDDDFSCINLGTISDNKKLSAVDKDLVEQGKAEIGGYPTPDLDSLFDEIWAEQGDTDSDSEFEDPVIPSLKRKRATNNSLAVGLDDNDTDFTVPAPAKRLRYDIKDKGVLIGVWKNSPEPDPSRKHAVYGYLAKDSSLRRKIYPESIDGIELPGGRPSGPSRFITHEDVILEPHLSALTSPQVKEFIQIRSAARCWNEAPDAKREADSLAVQEVIKRALEQPRTSNSTPIRTPAKAKPHFRYANIGDVRGVLIGYWKHSDLPLEDDKHAAYAVVDGSRMRIKVIQFTRDGRPCSIHWPGPGDQWIAYEDVVREPALANLTRSEVREYARLREIERKNGDPSAGIDIIVLDKAKSTVAAEAREKGLAVDQLDATTEQTRKMNNKRRKKARESGVYAVDEPREAEADSNLQYQGSSVGGPAIAKLRDAVSAGMPVETPTLPVQAKAIRSSKAESDARAERLKKARQVLDISAVDLSRGLQRTRDRQSSGEAEKETQKIVGESMQTQAHESEEKLAATRLKNLQEREARRLAAMEQRRLLKEQKERAAAKHQDAVSSRSSEASPAASTASRQRAPAYGGEQEVVQRAEAAKTRMVAMKEGIERAAARKPEEMAVAAREHELVKERVTAETARKVEQEAKERETATQREAAHLQAIQDEKESAQALARSKHAIAEAAKNKPLTNTHHQANLLPDKNESEEREQISTTSSAPPATTSAMQPFADVKWHNGVQYERKHAGPFAGNLVSKSPQVIKTDEEDYLEHRIIIPWSSSSFVSINGRTYARKNNLPLYPFAADKLVSLPEGLTIDGEEYLEYRVLK